MAISNGTVVIGSKDDNIYGLDVTNGSEVWSYLTGGIVLSGAAILDETAIMGCRDNNVYGVNLLDGTKEWEYTAGDYVESGIAIDDVSNLAVVGSDDTNVYGLQATNSDTYDTPKVSNGDVWIGKV